MYCVSEAVSPDFMNVMVETVSRNTEQEKKTLRGWGREFFFQGKFREATRLCVSFMTSFLPLCYAAPIQARQPFYVTMSEKWGLPQEKSSARIHSEVWHMTEETVRALLTLKLVLPKPMYCSPSPLHFVMCIYFFCLPGSHCYAYCLTALSLCCYVMLLCRLFSHRVFLDCKQSS